MGVLRTSSIIYSDLQLLGYLLGLSVVGYIDLFEAVTEGRPIPQLYGSGVRYVREPEGSEVWQSARLTWGLKAGDCEDLAGGWRVPELWSLGETGARPFVKRISPRLRHILVQRADGSFEDPSLILGMHAHRPTGAREEREALAAVKPPIPTPHIVLPWELPPLPASSSRRVS